MQEFINKYGGKTFGKFGSPSRSFDGQIKDALDQADKIRFNLDGVDIKQISGMLNELNEPVNGYTNYELYLIKNVPEYLKKAAFIKDGKIVKNPF